MTAQVFETTLKLSERGRVYIDIPFSPNDVWGKQPRHYVSGRLNDTAFHGSLASNDGVFYMPVNKALQGKANLNVGDTVKVTMKRAKPQVAEIPDELAGALAANPVARTFFEGLSAFQRNTYIGWVAEAKGADTRSKRVESTIENLLAGQKQRS
jgi:hypothetical protein